MLWEVVYMKNGGLEVDVAAEKTNINKVCDFTDLGGFAPAPLVFVLKVFGCCSIVAGLKIARSCPQRARTTLRPDRQSPKYGEKLRPKNRPWGEKPRKIPTGYYIELWIFEHETQELCCCRLLRAFFGY